MHINEEKRGQTETKTYRVASLLIIFIFRLGDYPSHLKAYGGKRVDMEYFAEAITRMKQQHDSAAFLVVSDDIEASRLNIIIG